MSIAFEHVSFCYDEQAKREEKWALRDLSLKVEKGSFTCVIGHTGSGKSTFIQLADALVKPTSGAVSVDGISTTAAAREVQRKVGVVFQYPEHQLFANTVAQDVGFGPRARGLSDPEVEERVGLALRQVGLDPDLVCGKSPFDFSGGQRRRIAFAGVLATSPEYLLLDEPMAGLDPRGRDEIMSYVRSLREQGMTIVMVSHSMDDVASLATSIIVLKDGSLFMKGSPEEVFSRGEEIRRIGLSVPVTTKLVCDLSKRGFSFKRNCYSLDELADAIAVQLGGRALGREGTGGFFG